MQPRALYGHIRKSINTWLSMTVSEVIDTFDLDAVERSSELKGWLLYCQILLENHRKAD
jgi:hypothetical protein